MKQGWYLIILLLVVLVSCTRGNQQLPTSTGRPYEVVLVGDTDSIVANMLMTDVAGLPQPEPMFDIINVKGKMRDRAYLNARLRFVVRMTDASRELNIKRATNVKSQPQTIIYLQTPSAEVLEKSLPTYAPQLISLLDSVELRHLTSVIKPNPEKQKEVKQYFDIDMKIHESMTFSKKGHDFLWLSNNANTGMQSLMVFKISKTSEYSEGIATVLRKNMPGEEDGMYMALATTENLEEALKSGKVTRGLWEMHGDAMGGPYVMRLLPREGYILVVMGFVYAPEMKKRNLTKQLEAMLTTIDQKAPR